MSDRAHLEARIAAQMDWLRQHVRNRLGAHLRIHAESADFVQQAVLDLLATERALDFDSEAGLRALLAQIVENDLRDRNKWLHRDKRSPDREAGPATDSVLMGAWREVTTPSSAVQREETRAWMLRALELLGPEDRAVIHMHEWQGLSHQEIGARLGISTDAARVRFQRALPKLALKVAELRRQS